MSSPRHRADTHRHSRPPYLGAAELGLAALVAALAGLALTGTGLPRPTLAVAAPLVWVPRRPGQVAQVDPLTGRVEARLRAGDRSGGPLEVSQLGGQLAVTDHATGAVLMLDAGTLAITGRRPGLAGGVRLLLTPFGTYVVELGRGVLRRVYPSTVEDVGQPFEAGAAVVDAAVGADGTLSLLTAGGAVESVRWNARSEQFTRTPATAPGALAHPDRATVVLAAGDRIVEVPVGPLGCARPWRPAILRGLVYVSCREAGRVVVLTTDGQPAGPDIALPGPVLPVRYDGGLLLAAGDQAVVVPETGETARSLRFSDPGVVVAEPGGSR